VIQTLELTGSLDGLHILRLLNHADAGFGSSRVATYVAKLGFGYVAALLTKPNSFFYFGEHLSQTFGLIGIGLK
jgi:hypothetical protein